jgi:hypothetical protein
LNATITASNVAIVDLCEYYGIDTSSYLDKTAYSIGVSDTPETGTTALTSQAKELYIGAIGSLSYPQIAGIGINGFLLLDGLNCNSYSLAYLEKIVDYISTASSQTNSGLAPYVGLIATFKAKFIPVTQTFHRVNVWFAPTILTIHLLAGLPLPPLAKIFPQTLVLLMIIFGCLGLLVAVMFYRKT